jgi:hypothetical protein
VALSEDMLFVELAKVVDDWLWRSRMIGNTLGLGLDYFGRLVLRNVNGKMENIAGGGEPIAWCGWLLLVLFAVKATRILGPFSFWTQGIWGNFCAMIGLTAMKHAVRRSKCVWASTTTVATIWCAASLIVLSESLIGGPRISFLRRCPKILLPIIWWPTTIRIDAVHWLWLVALTVIVVRGPWGFIWL